MKPKSISHHNFGTEGIELNFPENIYMYMEHLNSLGIIEAGSEKADINQERDAHTGQIKSKEYDFVVVRFTRFGEMFANSCIPEKLDNEDLRTSNTQSATGE